MRQIPETVMRFTRPVGKTLSFALSLFCLALPLSGTASAGWFDKAKERNAAKLGVKKHTIDVGGLKRKYYVRVPASAKSSPAPALIVLHPGKGQAIDSSMNKKMHALSDRTGVVLVFPNGKEQQWNVTPLWTHSAMGKFKFRADDVGFISAVLDEVLKQYNVDSKRVYATGMSSGGMMSLKLACEMSDRLAGVAAVAANLPADVANSCSPSKPVSVLLLNGTSDPYMPYEGGHLRMGDKDVFPLISAEETALLWAKKDGCQVPGKTRALKDKDPDDGTRVRRTKYEQCSSNSKVSLMTIEGGGHTWPGNPQKLKFMVKLLGRASQDVDGEQEIWSFFGFN